MAFVTTETNVIKTAGYQPATTIVYGTYTSSAGGTGGVISPGNTNASGTFTASTLGSVGCRKIINFSFTPGTADITMPSSVIAYNATRDRDEVTFTTVADATGFYRIECQDNGA